MIRKGFAAVLVTVMAVSTVSAQTFPAPTNMIARQVGAGFLLFKASLNLIAKNVNTKDDVYYNPQTGRLVIGVTNHPQRSGFEGESFTPGDCYYIIDTQFPGAQVVIADLNADGTEDVTLLRLDGHMREIRLSLMDVPNCDTTTAY